MKREKTGGRQKGTPNKRTVHFRKLLKELDFDPTVELVKELRKKTVVAVVQAVKKGQKPEEPFNSDKAKILRDLHEYLYPRRKPVEGPAVPASPAAPLAPGDGMEKLSREQLLELAKEKKGPIQ